MQQFILAVVGLSLGFAGFAAGFGTGPALADEPCASATGQTVEAISGTVSRGETFRERAGTLEFALEPRSHGWRIALYGPDGEALPVFAAPMRPVETNPLNLAGWHFRNAANDGENRGDVNAPQHSRRFAFGTLAAGGGHPDTIRPAQPGQSGAVGSGPAPGGQIGGFGEVTLGPFRLSPPAPGEQAHFEWLSFKACLAMAETEPGPDLAAVDPSPAGGSVRTDFEASARAVADCGLDLATYHVSRRMEGGPFGGQPGVLRPDMDGDGVPDRVVAVERRKDKRPGFAMCVGVPGRLYLAGYDGPIGRHLVPDFFKSVDIWAVHPKGPIDQIKLEGPPPNLRGDAVLLAKSETSGVLVFITAEGNLDSYWQGN